MSTQISLTRPDDWHLHLRDDGVLEHTVSASAAVFGRAIVMPNLASPVTTVAQALAYRDRILAASPPSSFTPLMTLYLTDSTTAADIDAVAESESVVAIKMYPAGATTNSAAGVTDIAGRDSIFATMQELDVPLLVHGEVTDPRIDVFDREQVFIETVLKPLRARFPDLRIVLEHITTASGVEFVRTAGERTAATITAHHLLYNRTDMFRGGVRPHYYCLPILKRERHRLALLEAATSGDAGFFLGTDSAPHTLGKKQSACGCAGIYSAPYALALYAEAFDAVGCIDKLEGFASFHGADFYGLPRHTDRVMLLRRDAEVPATLAFGDDVVVPIRAGEHIAWQLA